MKLQSIQSLYMAGLCLLICQFCVFSGCPQEWNQSESLQWILGSVVSSELHAGDSILTALNKMKQTDHYQHSNGLLQEFYTMTQKHNESIRKYAVRLYMAASKVFLQSQEALGSTPDEWGRLPVDHLLWSMNLWSTARLQIWDLPIMTSSNLRSRR